MIIANGYIEIKQKEIGGIDSETGYPIRPSYNWGNPIPCQITQNGFNAQSINNNEHITSSNYTLFVEEQEFEAEQIRLTDKKGKCLGEFSIKSIEPLEAVYQIKISI